MAKDWRRPNEAARKHWKQREAGQTSTAARGVKRLVFTILSVVLVGVLIWYLIPRGQKVYVAYLAEDYGPALRNPTKVEVATLAPPVASSQGVYRRAFAPLGERIFPKQFTVADVAASGNSKLAAQKLVESLTAPLKDKWNLNEVEFLVLYVNAHGVAIDGEPYLMWNEDYVRELGRKIDGQSQPDLMKLDDVLAQVRELPAKQKMLVLDGGRLFADPRLGFFVNEFPRLAQEKVAATGDRSLWAFLSHGEMEQARVFAADRTSVFGHFVAKGIAGASRSDEDADLSLREFVEYVSGRVSDTVAERTGEIQTPRFVNGNLGVLASGDIPNVTFLKHDFFNRKVEIASTSRGTGSIWSSAFVAATLGQNPSSPATQDAPAQPPATQPPATQPPAAPPATTAPATPPATPPAAAPPPTTSPAPASPAPPTTAPAPTTTTPPAPPPAPTTPPPKPAFTFELIWKKVAEVEDPTESPDAWSPVDYAPHLWSQLRRQLTWYETKYELESDSREQNAKFLEDEILAPLGQVLLKTSDQETAFTGSIDVFGELQRARAAFRSGAAYASAADTKRRSIQNFVAAVRLKNALTFRVVEQVRHYGFLPDPSSARYDALDAAIGELAAIATQLETETQASLNEDYWTSDLGLLGRLRNVRARLDEFPDVQRYSIAAATVPAAAPSTVARSKPREITDRQPAQWVDLYLKLARLSTRVESGSPPDDVALVSAAGPSNTALAEHADRIRRIAAGEVPRAEARDYWKSYRALGMAVRAYTDGLDDGLRRSADTTQDFAALCNFERRLRLLDGRDAPGMTQRDNPLPQRPICPRVAPRVEIVLAEAKIGLPPRSASGTARKVIAPAYRWSGEVGAKATVRVVYENQAAGSKVVRIVSQPTDITLAPQGTLPEIVLEQAADRKDKTNSETAKLRLVVTVAGSPTPPDTAELLVEAHGSELVNLAAYRVRDGVDMPIESRRDDEYAEELDEPRVSQGSVKPRLFRIRVQPFPNRPDQYRFKLTNVSGASGTRDVVVDLLSVREQVSDVFDTINDRGELDMRYFRELPEFRRELSLAANAAVTYPFVEPPKPMPEGAKPAEAPASAAPPAAAEKPKTPPPPVADFRHGLVFRVADKNNADLRWYYWIDFRARRPDRYVESIVTYDNNRGRLEILLKPRTDATQPPDGFAASWQADGVEIDPQLARTMEVIKKRTDEIRLNVNNWFPPEPKPGADLIPLFVNVDGYPRAFIHEFTPAVAPGVPIRPTLSFQRVKIVEPPRDLFAYKKDQPGEVHVNVGLEVDGQPSDVVYVRFKDGNNPDRPLTAWRAEHVLLFEKGWDKDGVLTLTQTVGDYVGADAIAFDTTLAESLIPVEVELRSGDSTRREDKLRVVVDEQQPSLRLGDPNPLTAPAAKGLQVTVTPTVSDVGGVARIEFFIFPESKDRLLDDDQKKPDFVWTPPVLPGEKFALPVVESTPIPVKIPFDRAPGRWSIWAVAVNQVERRSNPERTTNPFDLEEAMKETKPEKTGGVSITGITTLYDKPLPNVSLKLVPLEEGKGTPQSTTATDPNPVDFVDEAAYKFENVPPGKYKIVATGKAKNGRTVVGEVPNIVVKEGDTGTRQHDIKLALP